MYVINVPAIDQDLAVVQHGFYAVEKSSTLPTELHVLEFSADDYFFLSFCEISSLSQMVNVGFKIVWCLLGEGEEEGEGEGYRKGWSVCIS